MIDRKTDLKAACEAVERTRILFLIKQVHVVEVPVRAEPDVFASLTPEAALDPIREMERHGYRVGHESIVSLSSGARTDWPDEAMRSSLRLELSRAVPPHA